MKRAKPGQRIGEVITAEAYNRVLAATETVESGNGPNTGAGNNQSGLIKVKNNSGSDLGRFAAVAIGEPLFKPNAPEASGTKSSSFWRQPVVTVETLEADDSRKIVVMAEPVASGKVGFAVVSGITPAIVTKPASGDEFNGAKPVAGGLELTNAGGLPVAWWDSSGTGDIAAIVEVTTGGASCAAESDDSDCFKCLPDDFTAIEGYTGSAEQVLGHGTNGCLKWHTFTGCD